MDENSPNLVTLSSARIFCSLDKPSWNSFFCCSFFVHLLCKDVVGFSTIEKSFDDAVEKL
jgi:hypothetical protein